MLSDQGYSIIRELKLRGTSIRSDEQYVYLWDKKLTHVEFEQMCAYGMTWMIGVFVR